MSDFYIFNFTLCPNRMRLHVGVKFLIMMVSLVVDGCSGRMGIIFRNSSLLLGNVLERVLDKG